MLRTIHSTEYLTVEHFCTKPGCHALVDGRCSYKKKRPFVSENRLAYTIKR